MYMKEQESANPTLVRRRAIVGCIGSLPLLATPFASALSPYPTRPVRLVVPFPAGGSLDASSRILAAELGKKLSQTFIVDNISGASGKIGTNAVLAAPADGHTILSTYDGALSIPSLEEGDKRDLLSELQPISMFAELSMIVLSSQQFGPSKLRDLIHYAKENPGKVKYASPGVGSQHHLLMEMLCKRTGVSMLHVPYRGMTPMVTALLANECDVMFAGIAGPLPHIKTGRLRALAYAGANRHNLIPDVPTFAEAGLSGFRASSWFGTLIRQGAPKSVADTLAAAVWEIANSKGFREQVLLPNGYEPSPSVPPERFGAFLKEDRRMWQQAVDQLKVASNPGQLGR